MIRPIAISRLLPLLALAVSVVSQAEPLALKPYPEIHAAAQQAGGDFAVLFVGPDWLPETAAVRGALDQPATTAALTNIVGWASVPAEALAPGNVEKLNPKPDFTPYDLPALALVDAAGQTFAVAEAVTARNLPQAIKALAAAAPARARRDALFAKARAASGVASARQFGQGLDQIAFRFSSQRKDILAEIQKADPVDASGYTFKYTFNASGFHERVTQKLIAEKKQAELLAQVDQHLRNPVLLPTQRQALLSAKMQAYRSLDEIPRAVTVLRQIVAIDPRSELGTGATQYIRLLTEPVRLRGLRWESYDNRPTWLPMVADVSAALKEPGTYDIEFKHLDGSTRFRKVALKTGGREIASDANTTESRKLRLTVPATAKGRAIELWAESCGTGWFAGRGEIVVSKVP